ncbi:hypothetical protein DMC01_12215 [Campylobacter troglodytis]|nr:hypothetical protein DMC01_12215 [Campylobacter troglodytis]
MVLSKRWLCEIFICQIHSIKKAHFITCKEIKLRHNSKNLRQNSQQNLLKLIRENPLNHFEP